MTVTKALTPAPPWRPTKLSLSLEDRVCTVLRSSANVTLACQAVRIERRTYYNWINRAQHDLIALATELDVDQGDIDLEALPFDDHPHIHFLHATTKALGDFELENIAIIQQAAYGATTTKRTQSTKTTPAGQSVSVEETTTETRSWQAAAWLLERRWPESYARVSRHEVTGAGGGPVEVADPAVLRGKAEQVIAEVTERLAGGDLDLAEVID